MARKPKTEKKVPKLLGIEIVNQCPCGAVVNPGEQQELVMHPDKKKWYRVCKRCLARDRAFTAPISSPPPNNPGLHVA